MVRAVKGPIQYFEDVNRKCDQKLREQANSLHYVENIILNVASIFKRFHSYAKENGEMQKFKRNSI